MAGNPTFKKRQKELARQEKQRAKALRREQRKAERGTLEELEGADGVIPPPPSSQEESASGSDEAAAAEGTVEAAPAAGE